MKITIENDNESHEITENFKLYADKDVLHVLSDDILEQAVLINGDYPFAITVTVPAIVVKCGEDEFTLYGETKIRGRKLALLNIAQQLEDEADKLEIGWAEIESFEEPESQNIKDIRIIKEIRQGRFFQRVAKILNITY